MRAATALRLPQRELAAARAESKLQRRHAGMQSRHQRRVAVCSNGSTRPIARVRAAGSPLALGRRRPVAEAEQPRQRFGVRADGVGVAERLELLGRRQQQLLDDQVRDLVDARARASGGSADSLKSSRSSSARRIASNRWRSATTVGIAPRERSQAPNLLDFLGDDRLGARDLAGAARQVLAHGRLQIVDVVEEHLLDLAGRRLDVARQAMSMMNSGRLRRGRITASMCALVRIGAAAPVAVMTMSLAPSSGVELLPRRGASRRRSLRPSAPRAPSSG